jgi:hypothetical protein
MKHKENGIDGYLVCVEGYTGKWFIPIEMLKKNKNGNELLLDLQEKCAVPAPTFTVCFLFNKNIFYFIIVLFLLLIYVGS